MFAEHLFLVGQLGEIHRDGPDLPTGDRKPGAILRHAHTPFHSTGAGLREMARHPRHFGVVEGTHTDLIVGAQDAERRRHTAKVLGLERSTGAAEPREEDQPAPGFLSHQLTFPAFPRRSIEWSPHLAIARSSKPAQKLYQFLSARLPRSGMGLSSTLMLVANSV
jgi:hypothetical protein